jgi:hypothetical protein
MDELITDLISIPFIFFFLFPPSWLLVDQDVHMVQVSRSHFVIHTHTHSVGLLWTSDQPDAETSIWQHTTLTTDIQAAGGIRNRNPSRRAAVDRRLRPCGLWDRRVHLLSCDIFTLLIYLVQTAERKNSNGGCRKFIQSSLFHSQVYGMGGGERDVSETQFAVRLQL